MSGRLVPILLAAGVGITSGVYIWNEPLQQATGLRPAPEGVTPVINWKAQDEERLAEAEDAAAAKKKAVNVTQEAGKAAEAGAPSAGTPPVPTPVQAGEAPRAPPAAAPSDKKLV